MDGLQSKANDFFVEKNILYAFKMKELYLHICGDITNISHKSRFIEKLRLKRIVLSDVGHL